MDVTYNFTAGTRAVAQQVNQNFADVKTAVDTLESDVVEIQTEISGLNFVKADGTVDFTRLQSYKTFVVSNATNATPIVITAVGNNYVTGDKVYIVGVGGNTAANGVFTVTKIGTDTFSLDGSVGNGTFTTNGTVVIYPSANKDLVSKAYVDNGDAKTTIPLGTCTTASTDLTLTGTVTATSGSTTVTGTSTLFNTECPVGSTIVINGTPCYVSAVASNTSLTISQAYANTTGTYTAYRANNAKVITTTSGNFTLTNGATLKFLNTNKNFGYTPTINVDGSGAKLLASEDENDVSVTNPCFIPESCEIEVEYNSSLNRFIYKNKVVKPYVNGTSWYRVWTNGWIEQGGRAVALGASEGRNIIFPIAFKNTNYYATCARQANNLTSSYTVSIVPVNVAYAGLLGNNQVACDVSWKVEGY